MPLATIKDLLTPIDGLDAGKTTNLYAAYGGRDEETLDEAKKRARRQLRARDRAVTVEDFEQLATEAGNVKRAKALPLAHPQFPGVAVPGAVTVIVVPDSDADPPMPSDGLLRTVCAYLDARRLLTTELFVVAPRYVAVEIDAQIVVTDDADPGAVHDAVDAGACRRTCIRCAAATTAAAGPSAARFAIRSSCSACSRSPAWTASKSSSSRSKASRSPSARTFRIDTLAPNALPHLAAHCAVESRLTAARISPKREAQAVDERAIRACCRAPRRRTTRTRSCSRAGSVPTRGADFRIAIGRATSTLPRPPTC